MKYLRSLFAGLLSTTCASAAQSVAPKNPSEMMRDMRNGWLTRVPEKGTYKSEGEVVAVVMDWPLAEQTITVLSSSAGDASLYTTSTFGIIGGVGHEKVRRAAAAFVECAQRYLRLTVPTAVYPYPDNRTLQFYMVTPLGVRTVSFPLQDIDRADSPARALYAAGQDVVTELRLLTPVKQ